MNNKLSIIKSYIMFICELLPIDNVPVVDVRINNKLFDLEGRELSNYESFDNVKGKFITGTNYLFINYDMHNNKEEFITIAHELRHAYQFQEIKSNTPIETDDVILAWKNNIDNYINFIDDESYYNQIVELDANSFAYYICEKLFNNYLTFNKKTNLKEVENLICNLNEEYDDKDIFECLFLSRFDCNAALK